MRPAQRRPVAAARTVALFARMTSTPVLFALALLLVLVVGTITITTGGLAGESASIAAPLPVAAQTPP